nr:MAG TPA: hypothetical protein [Caudoviricetes sp.]
MSIADFAFLRFFASFLQKHLAFLQVAIYIKFRRRNVKCLQDRE